jgi:hypothetical protein
MTTPTLRKMKLKGKTVRLLDFHIYDDFPNPNESKSAYRPPTFSVQMYGINEKGETFSILVQDYQPFFYVLVADHWTQDHCDNLHQELLSKLGGKRAESSITSVKLVQYNKLYGFTAGKQSKFAQLTFVNSMTMMRTRNLWYRTEPSDGGPLVPPIRKLHPLYSQNCRLELYESRLPPLLRYFHINHISPSGWLFVPQHALVAQEEQVTTCMFEYRCHVKDIIVQPQKETRVPYKICSFDIEASSSHGDFPLPIKTYKRLASQLVDVFTLQTQGMMDATKERALITRIILSAFGYGKFQDIDLVYPKQTHAKMTRTQLENVCIPQWLAHICLNEDGSPIIHSTAASVLSIENLFEKMSTQNTQGNGGEEDGEGGEGEEDGEPGGGNPPHEMEVYELELEEEPKKKVTKKKAATKANTTKKESELSIFDMLHMDKYTRDEKITMTNAAFCNPDNGFPPLEGDQVTFIGSTFMRYGESEPYMNHCLVLNSCDPVPGTIIETVTHERDLLTQWAQLIQT